MCTDVKRINPKQLQYQANFSSVTVTTPALLQYLDEAVQTELPKGIVLTQQVVECRTHVVRAVVHWKFNFKQIQLYIIFGFVFHESVEFHRQNVEGKRQNGDDNKLITHSDLLLSSSSSCWCTWQSAQCAASRRTAQTSWTAPCPCRWDRARRTRTTWWWWCHAWARPGDGQGLSYVISRDLKKSWNRWGSASCSPSLGSTEGKEQIMQETKPF